MELLTVDKNIKLIDHPLGDKIIKVNQFSIGIQHNGLLYGIKHINIINKITFLFTNYRSVYNIEGKLCDNVWRISDYLIPLFKLVEYSENMKLDIQIEVLSNSSNRFYSFVALYAQPLELDQITQIKSQMFLSIPTIKENTNIEFIGNIWRLSNKSSIN